MKIESGKFCLIRTHRELVVGITFRSSLFLLGFCVLVGCGGAEKFPVATATGTVLCEGKPVAKVLVYFEPVRTGESGVTGQMGTGVTDESGKFSVSTYGTKDGAVLGKHKIRVGKTENTGACNCALNSMTVQKTVDVTKDATNDFEIVLTKKSRSNADEAIED